MPLGPGWLAPDGSLASLGTDPRKHALKPHMVWVTATRVLDPVSALDVRRPNRLFGSCPLHLAAWRTAVQGIAMEP